MSNNSRWTFLVARRPLKRNNAGLSNAKDALAQIYDIVVA